ncbi:MAG: hypothetical protein DRJ63_04745 [Thermoprotei archaeon]|nr:MAG: hypothetical protein DRJ63_04745 [Thermoprotei archaeon]
MSKKVGFAIIGAGGMGSFYTRILKELPEAEVVAVVDINESRARELARQYNIGEYYSDWHKVLEKDYVDAVAVCTPVKFHKEIAVVALESGKHVICEKPPAMNASEAEEMAEAAKRSKKILLYGFQWRFKASSRYVKRLVEKDYLGKIYRVRVHYLRKSIPLGAGKWFIRKELAGGGILIDCGVHFIDLAYWLLGRPKPIEAFGVGYDYLGRQQFEEFGVEDTFIGMVFFENGTTLVIENAWMQNWREEHGFTVYGTRGSASIYPSLEVYLDLEGNYSFVKPEVKEIEPTVLKLKHFIEATEKGYSDISPRPEDGVVVMKIIDALYESAVKRKSVEISV